MTYNIIYNYIYKYDWVQYNFKKLWWKHKGAKLPSGSQNNNSN